MSPPDVGSEERALLLEAFDSNWIAPIGPQVDAFEAEMAAYVGVSSAAALSSGTAALHLALELLGVGRGDAVLVSTLTFAATANAVRYVGGTPVFVDSDRTSWNMDPDLLAEELHRRAKRGELPAAVIVVDLYGQCADYDRILPVCAEYDVPVIEDAAEALGATHGARRAGSLGLVSVLSFNGNKIITTSGGGMLLSDRSDLVERARYLATQARDPAPHYEHSVVGYNYRLSNLLAAVGRAQLRGLETKIERRRAHYAYYRRELGSLPGVDFMPEPAYGRSTRWLTCVVLDDDALGVSRDAVLAQMASRQIEARPVWKPMHLQPVHQHCSVVGGSVSEELFARGLCLPSGSSLTESERTRVVEAFSSTPGLTAEAAP